MKFDQTFKRRRSGCGLQLELSWAHQIE